MTLNSASLSRALPHPCRQPRRFPRALGAGPCPIGRAQQGVRGKACNCSFPDIVLATYRGMEGGGLWRCWRRRYSPDAASAPSRVAMAAPPVRGAAAPTDWPRTPQPRTADEAGAAASGQTPRQEAGCRTACPPTPLDSRYTLRSPKGSGVNFK